MTIFGIKSGWIVAFTASVSALFLYIMNKMLRAPRYNPGDVAKASLSESFDRDELITKSTDTTWSMPDGIEIYHFPVKDTEGMPILGLHGGPGIPPDEPWAISEQLPSLCVYHARGCGKSTRPFSNFPSSGMWPGVKILEEVLGIGAQIADIERIRRRLGVDKLILVGHSFGGFISAMYAAEFPQHVQSLILLAPAAVLQLPIPNGEKGLFDVMEEKLKELGNQKHIDEYDDFFRRYFDFSDLPNQTDESLAKLQNELVIHYRRADQQRTDEKIDNVEAGSTGGMSVYAAYLSMGMEHDYSSAMRQRLKDSTFPVTIVHGTNDLTPPISSRRYVDIFPTANVKWVELEDSHFLHANPLVAEIVKATLS
jgi:proline iminopeptidase